MLMIEKNRTNEIMIEKSKFINYLFILENIDDVTKYLNQIKTEYKDATHYCYAYIFNNIKHFSDDNEPSGTAGMPMLNVLESNNLTNVLTITIRYFGGIKLGAGGLVRAYTKSVTENLKNINIYEYVEGYSFDISFQYELKEFFESKLKEYVKNKYFDNFINYNICVKVNEFNKINELLKKHNIEIKNFKEIKIKA